MLLTLERRRVYYDLTGSETGPVVCMTHSLASDSGMWSEQMPALLGAGYRVLRLDMRGHGGSEATPGDYTMTQLADDVAAVLDALSIDKAAYIGLSIGGMIGQDFAIHHGNRLTSMMVCDTSPGSPANATATWGPRIEMVRKAKSAAPLAKSTMERWFTPDFKVQKPRRWQEIHDTVVATTPDGLMGCAAALQSFDIAAKLPSIKVPTLVVCGADDPGTPPSVNRYIAELIPGGRYEEIAEARHLPNIECAEVFNKLMLSWLGQRH